MKRNAILLLMALALVGCGGGGGGSTSTGGNTPPPVGTSRNVRLFATDSVRDDYSGVWVVLRRIAAVGPSGETVLVDEPAGKPIDVRALGTATGRNFRLLGAATLPAGATSLKVTVESAVLLVNTGAVAGQRAQFEGSGETRDFDVPLGNSTDPDVILDFDLGQWNLSGGQLSATNGKFVRRIDDNGVDDPGNHVAEDFKGIVAGLAGTAPSQTFTLGNLKVRLDANTAVFNGNGAPSAALANGQRVEVEGTLDPTSNTIHASSVKIEDGEREDEAEAKGIVTAKGDGTLTITLTRVRGFLPDAANATVATTDATLYFANSGASLTRAEFFAQVAVNGEIEAEGTYANGTLTARVVKLEDGEDDHGGGGGHHGGGGEAEIEGTAGSVDTAALSFKVAADEWEGISLPAGSQVTVVFAPGAELELNGDDVTPAAFLAGIDGRRVKVEGTYDPKTQTLTAEEAKAR